MAAGTTGAERGICLQLFQLYSFSLSALNLGISLHTPAAPDSSPLTVSTAHLSRWHGPFLAVRLGVNCCIPTWAALATPPISDSLPGCAVSALALSLPFQYWLTQPGFLSCSRCPCCLYHFWFFSHFTGISQWKSVSFKLFLFKCFPKSVIKLLCNYLIKIIKIIISLIWNAHHKTTVSKHLTNWDRPQQTISAVKRKPLKDSFLCFPWRVPDSWFLDQCTLKTTSSLRAGILFHSSFPSCIKYHNK